MSPFVVKSPGIDLTHSVRFAPPLLAPGESVLGDAGWSVRAAGPGSGHGAADLRIAAQTVIGDRAVAVFEGGRPGASYMVTVTVDTSAGRELRQAFVLAVGRRKGAVTRERGEKTCS